MHQYKQTIPHECMFVIVDLENTVDMIQFAISNVNEKIPTTRRVFDLGQNDFDGLRSW